MGYNTITKLLCTKPDLISSGSTFSQTTHSRLLGNNNGETEYLSKEYYIIDDIIELSKKYPNETFTGVTWNDSDFYNSVSDTIVYKNGHGKVIKVEPYYQFLYPVIDDEIYNKLVERFIEEVRLYIKRIDIIKEDVDDPVDGTVFDFLNDIEDDNGFKSYYTITWENDQHKFTATKRLTSNILIHYEKKEPINK